MSTAIELATHPGQIASQRSLTRAFECFTEAAASLERSYHRLESEIVRLRRELEERNAELARSLDENRRMRDSLAHILSGLPCGVIVAGPGGKLSLVNRAAAALLGASDYDRVSQLPPAVRALLEQVQLRPGEWELEIPSSWGEVRSLIIRHATLGTLERESVFILQDVSERKRLELERERLDRQRALAEMSAVLAHEIRNPLGSLELFAGLLAGSELEPEHRAWVEHLQAGLRTLAATANNVLYFHNLPSPQLALTDMGQLLDWVCDFLLPLARQSGMQLALDNQLAGVLVRADRHRLEQVLLNLAINSLRFLAQGGSLALSGRVLAAPGQIVEVEVADNGPGVAPQHLPRIFEAGFTTRPGSPGLGLTVCKTIIEQHGGTIEARNRIEGGASFRLQLPLGDKTCCRS